MKEVIEVIAKALVTKSEEVKVTEDNDGDVVHLELKVADCDVGKVIGHGGKIAKSIRNVVKAVAVRENKKVIVDIGG